MPKKQSYRSFREVEEEYFRAHPDEIESYIEEIFAAFAEDNNTPALLASLRIVAKVKGISVLAQEANMTRQGIQHALSEKGNPRFDNINAIMHALGYRLTPQRVEY